MNLEHTERYFGGLVYCRRQTWKVRLTEIRFRPGLAESDLPWDELSLSASEPDARGISGNVDAKEAKLVSINNTNIALA